MLSQNQENTTNSASKFGNLNLDDICRFEQKSGPIKLAVIHE